MSATRRQFAFAGAGLAAAPAAAQAAPTVSRYGLISQLLATEGRRDDLADILVAATQGMEGCLAYVVARDVASADALWITELWTSREAHDASLALPAVRAAIARGRPLIASVGVHAETVPLERMVG